MTQTPVQYVKGVGPRLAERLGRLEIRTAADLLTHLPFRYVDRRAVDQTGLVEEGPDRTVVGQVVSHGISKVGRHRRIYRAIIDDGSGPVVATWFHFRESFLKQQLPTGSCVMLSGDVRRFGHQRQFTHPDIEAQGSATLPTISARIVPIYPSTEGLTQRLLRKIIAAAWQIYAEEVPGTFPAIIVERYGLTSRRAAMESLHFPPNAADLEALNHRTSAAHQSLIFEEIFFLELGLALRRAAMKREIGTPIPWDEPAAEQMRRTFPFILTGAQQRVIEEIRADLQRTAPMHRLVQGDVGSGKTAVAAAIAHQVIKQGWQVALMAPTEILAEQHAHTLRPWMEAVGIPLGLVMAKTPPAEKKKMMQALASGELPLVVGTHALIEEAVQFANLGLLIIDEQHRFGVAQRLTLKEKGRQPHLLALTATPIPRTLAMTYYGDLDISAIDELPTGRLPIVTKQYREKQRDKLYAGMRKELAKGRQIYVVYPLIEESAKVDLKDATAMAKELGTIFAPDYRVALLHGRMKGEEKETIMRAFQSGASHILATTSVVEVGVDVPNASVMVIEHAERFGLAQLHQMRGRVGRANHQSYCILMTGHTGSEDAAQRLKIMTETTDGFRIAEEDLKIRGPGEILGTRQSGLPELKIARLVEDAAIIEEARASAFTLLDQDPGLAHHADLKAELLQRWGALVY